MVLAVPKAFILNSLLDSKLSDSLFTIKPHIYHVTSINVKKYQKIPKMINVISYYNTLSSTYKFC